MIKFIASLGAFAALGLSGTAFAQSSYSPPMQEPAVRYALPAAALAERSVLPSGLVFEGRSVHMHSPAETFMLPEPPAFPNGLPLNLEPTPRPASTGSSFHSMYA